MPAPDIPGPHILLTKNGGFYAVENLRAEADWVIADSSGLETSFPIGEVSQILAVSKTDQLSDVAQANEFAAGILRLESLVAEYRKAKPHSADKLEIAIFGAASLALTVLPGTSTGDIDLVANTDFIRFLDKRKNETNLGFDILPPSFLIYLGNWRERASRLMGYSGTAFLVFHPMDTVVQKLLRVQPEKFDSKDWPEIAEVMKIFKPTADSMVTLMTENVARFRMADEGEEAAMKRNTSKFLERYLPAWNYERLRSEAMERRSKERRGAGFEPMPELEMPKIIELKQRNPPQNWEMET